MMNDLVKQESKKFGSLLNELFSNASMWDRPEPKFPAVNISEDDNNFEVELYAPGLEKDDFKVNIENGFLTISYDKKTEKSDKKHYRTEFHQSSFKRSFNIDDSNIDTSKIQASYKKGILKLILPKKEKAKVIPQQIEIQ